jgi:hypothetical protein
MGAFMDTLLYFLPLTFAPLGFRIASLNDVTKPVEPLAIL